MEKIVYYIMGLLLFFTACSDEDNENLSPSYADKAWYVLNDSDDPVDHLLYEMFDTYGLPVFYNDTIGKEDRGVSLDGLPIIHYEVIDINYWITNRTPATVKYTLNKKYMMQSDKNEIALAADLLQKYVFPRLKKSKYPLSFLLVDSIVNDHSDLRAKHYFSTFYSMTTTLVGGLNQLEMMTEYDKKLLAGYILAELYVYDIKNNAAYMNLFKDFFEQSVDLTGQPLHGVKKGSVSNYVTSSSSILPANDWLKYGFLRFNPKSLVYLLASRQNGKIQINYDLSTIDTKLVGYYCPLREQDLYEYMAYVFVDEDEVFKTKYADYAIVLKKYDLVKHALQEYLKLIE